MPIQAPQWTEYLSCPVCEHGFELKVRLPISLGCGHSICKTCLANLQRNQCPFDQCNINISLEKLPVNTALTLLLDSDASVGEPPSEGDGEGEDSFVYKNAMHSLEKLAVLLRPSNNQQLSRPMQRKMVTLINCQPLEEEGRSRAIRAARSLGERSVTELILQHQNPQQLSANLWAAVRTRGCQFLGPAMQEEVLKLVLLALEDGAALSRKVLVMFVVQRLEPQFPQASKTSIGHVVQLLYRASCFKVTKRDGDSSLMQLKEEFRTYETLRREHDAQIVQIATEAGLRIAPDQWSSLLYGDSAHKSHMQSIIDKLQTPQSFLQSVQELVIALQRTGDPGKLTALRPHLDFLSSLDPSPENSVNDWSSLNKALLASEKVVVGLLTYMTQHNARRIAERQSSGPPSGIENSRYKTSMCRDLSVNRSCPRGKNCTFAHSAAEMEQYRNKTVKNSAPAAAATKMVDGPTPAPRAQRPQAVFGGRQSSQDKQQLQLPIRVPPLMQASPCVTPVAQVAPVPRGYQDPPPPPPPAQTPQMMPMVRYRQQQYGPESMEQQVVTFVPPGQPQGAIITHPPSAPPQFAPMVGPHHQSIMPHPQTQVVVDHQGLGPEFQSQQLYFHTIEEVQVPDIFDAKKEPCDFQQARVATKSLSALKSRKDEIMDSLQDIIGEDGAKMIQCRTRELASSLQKNAPVLSEHQFVTNIKDNGANHEKVSDNYSLWTSRVFTPFVKATSEEVEWKRGEDVYCSDFAGKDEVIPFSDTPTISRFGPISRRSGRTTTTHTYRTSNTQAAIDDETQPTPVVTNSKQMSRPVGPTSGPPIAFLQSLNGTLTALQPVAYGLNGEIGYVAAASPIAAAQGPDSLELRHIGLQAPTNQNNVAQPERMKHEMEILQRKISGLNLAKMTSMPHAAETEVAIEESNSHSSRERSEEMDKLTSELQIIENTIVDREIEISINHQQKNPPPQQPKGLDYGSYTSQGMYEDERNHTSGSSAPKEVLITTIARSGQTPRSTGRFFEPF